MGWSDDDGGRSSGGLLGSWQLLPHEHAQWVGQIGCKEAALGKAKTPVEPGRFG